MKYADAIVDDWIERINTEARNLSEWETSFMESITERWDATRTLSDKQLEIVERIYTNKVS